MSIFNLQNVLSNKIEFQKDFKEFDNLTEIIKNNRHSLSKIKTWINEEISKNSVYNYGIPGDIQDLINLPINDEPIYTDYIVAYGKQLNRQCNYLELGVSVGKNFFQVLNSFENSKLTSIDIEEINPILEKQLNFIGSYEYERMPKSIKQTNFSLKEYTYNNNVINYYSADIWDEKTWEKLAGQKFNLVFSDAFHDPKAILFEFKMIEKYELLDDQFIFFWDDLVDKMNEAYIKIAKRIKKRYKLDDSSLNLVKINGWLGQNYPIKHDVGLITNIK